MNQNKTENALKTQILFHQHAKLPFDGDKEIVKLAKALSFSNSMLMNNWLFWNFFYLSEKTDFSNLNVSLICWNENESSTITSEIHSIKKF